MDKIKPRELKKNPTDAERALWRRLRLRQFSGYKFGRQQPVGNYIGDFVCFEKGLIIEVNGSHHAEQVAYDSKHKAGLAREEFRIITVWGE